MRLRLAAVVALAAMLSTPVGALWCQISCSSDSRSSMADCHQPSQASSRLTHATHGCDRHTLASSSIAAVVIKPLPLPGHDGHQLPTRALAATARWAPLFP